VICGGNERMRLERLVDSTEHELERAGVGDSVEVALADAGFWNTDQIARLTARGTKTLVTLTRLDGSHPPRTDNADSTTSRCENS
jgi:predicted flap endonuclease-1-like 5' DNA nuclease